MITGIRVIEIDWWSIESVDLIGLVGFKECWLDLGVDWRNSWGVIIAGNLILGTRLVEIGGWGLESAKLKWLVGF